MYHVYIHNLYSSFVNYEEMFFAASMFTLVNVLVVFGAWEAIPILHILRSLSHLSIVHKMFKDYRSEKDSNLQHHRQWYMIIYIYCCFTLRMTVIAVVLPRSAGFIWLLAYSDLQVFPGVYWLVHLPE